MGRKNFSRNNVGQRRAGDFYQTPPSMTRQFLDAMPVTEFPVLEPAQGEKAITRVLTERYGSMNVVGYDITDGRDFLKEEKRWPTILTNPPFSLSTQFIKKCKERAINRFSLLMPIDYLHGKERYQEIYSINDGWSLAHIHVYVRRAMMDGEVRADGRYHCGMITWAWFTWLRKRGKRTEPRVHWIDNDGFVIRNPARKTLPREAEKS